MRTFLITWNPRRWEWTTLAEAAAAVGSGRVVDDRWSCGKRKDIRPGERLFLLRQSKEPRGIVGAGWATSPTYQDVHWEEGHGGTANYVDLRFDTLLDSDSDPDAVLRVGALSPSLRRRVHWNTQASGIFVPGDAAVELETAWASHLASSPAFDEEIATLEGEARHRLIVHRRREQRLRDAKISAALRAGGGRLKCEVPGCGFDFLAMYGEVGRGYAQVHHLEPLGGLSRPKLTSLKALAIVCANCHAMIHRGGKCRRMKTLLKRSRSGTTGA